MSLDLSGLNIAQREAVLCTKGPLLVLAGAGSGKTSVLTNRIAHLIEDELVSPLSILAITFTNKAAGEMRERLSLLLEGRGRGLWALTFHALGVRILRRDGERLGFSRNFSVYDDDDSKRLVKAICADLNIDVKRFSIASIRDRISKAKNELIGPVEFETTAANYVDGLVAKVYIELQARLQRANAMDFDDLLFNTYRLLNSNDDVLASYHRRFEYLLVDEYQDTNQAQYQICSLLAQASRNIMVVGDDDQSIYSWRGADIRNILEFEKDYPDAKIVTLEQNYRSTGNILNAANKVIAHNKSRKPKKLFTAGDNGAKIALYQATDERDEGRWIAARIDQLHNTGKPYEQFAVLYRTNAQSRILEDMLLRAGIPYRIVGGTRFFDREEIRDTVAYLKLAVNPADDMAVRRVVNKPRRGIGKATIEQIDVVAQTQQVTFMQALEIYLENPELRTATFKALATFKSLCDQIQTYEGELRPLVEMIVERSGLISALEHERSDESLSRVENIKEFFGVVGEFDETHTDETPDDGATQTSRLGDFLEWLALRSDLDNLAEDNDAITLMTVHSAKGLEFPVVFIAGIEESVFPHFMSAEDRKGIEEERRLAYVAITRAKSLLHLSYALQRSLYGQTRNNPRSRFVDELPFEVLELHGVGSRDLKGTGFEKRGSRSGVFGSGTESSGKERAAANSKKQPTLKLEVGDNVDHKIFGRGVVLDVKGDQLAIKFERSGQTKKLLASLAPIVKLS
jgi:DNA helicase-2/ATP-dependent DNA helicase PcrA